MSAQVQKLEALLARVQDRRDQPRPARASLVSNDSGELSDEPTGVRNAPDTVPNAPPVQAPVAAAREDTELSFADVRSTHPPGGAAAQDKRADSPLQDAMNQFTSASPPPAAQAGAPAAKLRPITLPDADEEPSAPIASGPDRRIPHAAPEASGPVARSEGQAVASPALSFEQLVARSLALKPRA